ncbi:MAG: oxygenase MpaB family protein [Polaromonas sp.]|nr:oxygenase MpaB family protein [Polaromonas sp.]
MTSAHHPMATGSPLWLPPFLQRRIDRAADSLLQPLGSPVRDFSQPRGETALAPHDAVSWKVFRNPVALFIGGIAAVILELAEPGVRTGVWEHSSFRRDPMQRLQRTGLAAMVTIYGARSVAEQMIAGVVRRHSQVTGTTPSGAAYHANDVELLDWVQATAGFGFSTAYSRYVYPLSDEALDRFYGESVASARLYGAVTAPASKAELEALFDAMRDRLEPSPIVFEFLTIMRDAPIFPAAFRSLQRLLIRAAVEMTPAWVRERLGLGPAYGLQPFEAPLVRFAGRFADRIMLRSSPAVQACLRLGLPADYLYRG